MKLLMCNLKANKTLDEFVEYIEEIEKIDNKESFAIFPSHLYLGVASNYTVPFGSQDISLYTEGASTGEVTINQIKSTGAKFTILGHSERRAKFAEDERLLLNKINLALEADLKVIYCIGESLEEKSRQKTYQILEKQIAKVFNSLTEENLKNIIIAYEPIWAIGTGVSATMDEIAATTEFIKKLVMDYYNVEMQVLYGGSVNSKNIADINKIESVDGFLVGSASLNVEEVNKMYQIIK